MAALVGLVVLVAGGVAIATPFHWSVPAGARANQRTARRDVRALLAKVALPSGAVIVARDPATDARLSQPSSAPDTPALVDTHRFLRVADSPSDVIAWFQAHVPTGSSADGWGSGAGPGYDFDSASFGFPARPDVLTSRQVAVAATEARGGGTAVRIDAEDVYYVPRPRWERVPSGVTAIDVTMTQLNPYRKSSYSLTDAAKISKVVAWVNALAPGQPGVTACPADFGPEVALKFVPAARLAPVAAVDADGSGCGGVSVKLRGKRAPGLNGGPELIARLRNLLGF